MDTGREEESFFTAGVDNSSRRDALSLVENIETPQQLLDFAYHYFNSSVMTLEADQILDYFADDNISSNLAMTEGFDATLFRGVVLFELAHTNDEEVIPIVVDRLSKFWSEVDDDIQLERMYTSESKRYAPKPFVNYSRQIAMAITMAGYELIESRRPTPEPELQDPLVREIDGSEWKLMIGAHELKSPDRHSVLNRGLLRDLMKLFPSIIVREVEYLFPDDGKFEDIQPMIDKVTADRMVGIPASEEDIVQGYQRLKQRASRMFHQDEPGESVSEEDIKQEAIDYYMATFRSRPQIVPVEYFLTETHQWYTIARMRPDHQKNIEYRRVFVGDFTCPEMVELPVEQHGPVNEYVAEMEAQFKQTAGGSRQELEIHSIFGGFEPYMLPWQANLPVKSPRDN